jgi:hypothetical protein
MLESRDSGRPWWLFLPHCFLGVVILSSSFPRRRWCQCHSFLCRPLLVSWSSFLSSSIPRRCRCWCHLSLRRSFASNQAVFFCFCMTLTCFPLACLLSFFSRECSSCFLILELVLRDCLAAFSPSSVVLACPSVAFSFFVCLVYLSVAFSFP